MAEHHHGLTVERRQSADQGRVVAKGAVTMQLDPAGGQRTDVIQGMGTIGVTSEFDSFPGTRWARTVTAGSTIADGRELRIEEDLLLGLAAVALPRGVVL